MYKVENRGEEVTGGAKGDRLRHPKTAKHASLSSSSAATYRVHCQRLSRLTVCVCLLYSITTANNRAENPVLLFA